MSQKYEKNIYFAMLAEQCGRYDEMVNFLEDLVKSRNKDWTVDERNLLSISYTNMISGKRSALRLIVAYEIKEKKKESFDFLPYIREYHKQIEAQLIKQCQAVLRTIDNHLLKLAIQDESKVFYLKMKGDYNRYIAENAENELREKVSQAALLAYTDASVTSKNLPVLNPVRWGVALNFSLFYYEVMNDHENAIIVAKEQYDLVSKELMNVNEEAPEYKDSLTIYNWLQENLEAWQSEGEGENK